MRYLQLYKQEEEEQQQRERQQERQQADQPQTSFTNELKDVNKFIIYNNFSGNISMTVNN